MKTKKLATLQELSENHALDVGATSVPGLGTLTGYPSKADFEDVLDKTATSTVVDRPKVGVSLFGEFGAPCPRFSHLVSDSPEEKLRNMPLNNRIIEKKRRHQEEGAKRWKRMEEEGREEEVIREKSQYSFPQ